MQINDFARKSFERSQSKGKFDWEFYLIGMAGEVGEALNVLKKIKRGDFPLDKEKMAEEAADVITYAFLLLSSLSVDPEKTIMEKFEKVNKRLESGGFGKR